MAQATGLDVHLDGPGFFHFVDAAGRDVYSRDGRFRPDREMQLGLADGLRLEPSIVVPWESTNIHIDPEGEVFAWVAGSKEPKLVGVLEVIVFENPECLTALGGGRFVEAVDAPSNFTMVRSQTPAGRIVAGAIVPEGGVLTGVGETQER